MQVNIESPSALRRKVTIEVEPDEIKRELDHSYNELRRGVMLKGFRPGRAPRNMLERLFGDQVRGEVIQKLVKEYTEKALDENALKPIVAPEIITEETDLTKSLKFSAVFDLKPELVVKDYEGLKVPESRIEVGDKDVDEAIGVMRERQATLKKIEDRTVVREGDVVLASIEAFEGDKAVTALKAEDRMLRVSRESLAHGLEEVLIGAETGKLARGVKSYGADYSQADLAGKSIEWRITVKEIFQREVPELDDEFAKDNDFTSVEALKKRVRADLESQARAEADARARQGLLDLVIERNPTEIPESLVMRELHAMESELEATLEAGGLTHEQAQERVKAAADDLKTRAEKRARTALVLDALAEQEKIDVTGEELGDRVARIVTDSGRQRDRAAEFYRKEENREALRQSMRREKVLDMLLTRAKREDEVAAEPGPQA